MTAGIEPTDQTEALRAACTSVAELMSSAHGPLRRMHVQVGEVAVEVEWPDAQTAPAPAAPAQLAASPPSTTDSEAAPPVDSALHHVCAPGVGTFYEAPEPDADPFVKEGDRVEPGQQIGILEVMKLMVPVDADRAGRVVETLARNGQAVEFGQPLISIDPE
ncbi:MAG TPA: biotin/lipoyl-containing protein [Pseudonocardiaceae bacterium]|nr:biotin/lipoyl-containing protein [Pseudonocardiaceae bacterium]